MSTAVILLISAGFILVDQLSKWLAVMFLPQGSDTVVRIIPFVIRLVGHIKNDGMAWGLFSDKRWIFMTVSAIAIIGLIVYLFVHKPKDKLLCWSLSLILAGGVGNMIDRIFVGSVVDFIQFDKAVDVFRLVFKSDFPTFNVADSCVTIGAVMLIAYLIISIIKENKDAKAKNREIDGGGDGDGNKA